jgi:hypothetical protein
MFVGRASRTFWSGVANSGAACSNENVHFVERNLSKSVPVAATGPGLADPGDSSLRGPSSWPNPPAAATRNSCLRAMACGDASGRVARLAVDADADEMPCTRRANCSRLRVNWSRT